mmetsp:Transcript_46140/g.116806  ORF Transcript_46140/g.116806 Transcript_46140/m.116806 type:complete len:185 (-) Transcript_46140:226-780(-)|eukprot:jgi/Tetstr1/455747/TSEL_042546.t1
MQLACRSSALTSRNRPAGLRARPVAARAAAEPNPLIKGMSAGMGLLKPIFGVEAKLQGAALGRLSRYTIDDAIAQIEQDKKANKVLIYTYGLSPFSTEALALLESTGYQFTKVELGLEWFTLGGRGSQMRVALGDMVENGGTSLPKIFIGGQPLGGASGYSALAAAVEDGTLEGLLKRSGAKKL